MCFYNRLNAEGDMRIKLLKHETVPHFLIFCFRKYGYFSKKNVLSTGYCVLNGIKK